jgi:PAS domain S-box-containing protein
MVSPHRQNNTTLDSVHLLRMVHHAQQTFIRGKSTTKEIFDTLLTALLTVTESEYGFIGKVLIGSDDKPFLKTLSITNIAWNEETRALYEKHKSEGMEFYILQSLYGQVLSNAKPYIANKPASDPHKHGIPSGHPALNAFLGVPIINGEMIGMFGVANRAGGYSPEIIEFLEPLTATCAVLLQAITERDEHERDIARLQLSHENLYRNEQFLRSLVESQTSYLVRTDLQGRYTYVNQGFTDHFGFLGKVEGMDSLETIHPDDVPACIAAVEHCLKHPGEMYTVQIRKPRAGGVYLETEWEFIAVCDTDDVPYQIQCVGRDISERKRAEKHIEELNQNLIALNQSLEARVEVRTRTLRSLNSEKNEFLGIAAHDLKNPLSAIKLSAERILLHFERGTLASIPKIAQTINLASEKMLDIIVNLLEINNLESGEYQLHPEPINTGLIVEIVDEYQSRALAKNISMIYEQTEIITFQADKNSLHHIVDNLISNAVKFSPSSKSIYVRLLKRVLENGGIVARLEVQDEGQGLTEEDHKRLFSKFARLSARPTGGEHSTGLGLSIVKKLVEMQDGRVWCESEHGKGATFIVEFPTKTP